LSDQVLAAADEVTRISGSVRDEADPISDVNPVNRR
jgi:hypothetical protein